MRKIFFIAIMFPSIIIAQIGINTVTPQKTLHVNGSLQIVNELNVGGSNTSAGNSGTRGQVLTSQGSGNPPLWTTLDMPTQDTNSFKLKAVYTYNLFDIYTNTNGNYIELGRFNNIKINSSNNYIIIEFQASTSVIKLDAGESMSYRYRLSGNNGISTIYSPYFYIQSSNFNPINNVTSYKFFLENLSPNTYEIVINATRANALGTNTSSKYIHFNRTYDTANSFNRDGKAFIYVYEK